MGGKRGKGIVNLAKKRIVRMFIGILQCETIIIIPVTIVRAIIGSLEIIIRSMS